MSVFFLILVAIVATFGAVGMSARRAQSLRNWQLAAADLGLQFSGKETERFITGKLRGATVRAEFRRRRVGKYEQETTLLGATGDGSIPRSLTVREDTPGRKLGRLLGGEDERIGHKWFDDAIELPSLDAYACAALSSEARQMLLSLIDMEGEVADGEVLWTSTSVQSHERAWLVERLQFLGRLAQLLAVGRDSLHQRLAQNALKDPSRGVRRRNFGFLVDPSTHAPPALLAETARAALADADAALRLLAARQLGAEGHAVLAALAADASEAAALRLDALRALDAGGAAVLPVHVARLLSAEPEVACGALAMCAARQLGSLSPAVVACIRSPNEAVRAAAATAIGKLRPDGAEQILLGSLQDPDSDVQIASAEALGELGSVVSVEPLLRLAQGIGRAPLRRAARAAIGRIQAQLGNVEAGSLSLAEDQELAGAVAVVETAAVRVGELSLAQEEAAASAQSESGLDATRNERRFR